jgi:beta-galactosidase
VVDHVGTNETRVFRAVQETGRRLKAIDEVAGSHVRARVAIVYDWENMWALDDSQGFQKNQKLYNETCYDYHKVLWEKGINVDIVRASADWSGYDLVIAPMLYMVGEQTAEKMAAYVEKGGHLYTTYMLGMVDDTDLCHLGGFPGGALKQVFGLWNEEIDTLYPEERVAVSGGFEAKDYCELIHARGCQVKAAYEGAFYAGMPAFTVNGYGAGKAYYQAFRDTGSFKRAALGDVLAELGIEGPVAELPVGVTAHTRCAEGVEYLFVENYNPAAATVTVEGHTDLETGEAVKQLAVPGYGIRVLKR